MTGFYGHKKETAGFTLVEVAIVVVIGGILLASASALLLNYMKKVQLGVTRDRQAALDEALQLFLNINGRYPCPANPAIAVDVAGFGLEEYDPVAGNCTPAAPSVTVAGRAVPAPARNVIIGVIPVRTLNLPDEFIADSWGMRFTYAVTETLAEDGTYDRQEGAISVLDSQNNEVTPPTPGPPPVGLGTAHYVIVSHGSNNSGARSLEGGGSLPCPVGAQETENCNGDAVFRRTILTSATAGANANDDVVSIRSMTAHGYDVPAGAVVAFNLNACPPGWVDFASARNSFVLGLGSAYPTLGQTGGQATVTLDQDEAGTLTYNAGATGVDPALLRSTTIAPNGVSFLTPVATVSHDNMPPYIALLYCEKS